jgi:sortase A
MFWRRGQSFIRWTRRILVITGALAIGYVGLTLLDAKLFQEKAALSLEKQIHAQEQHQPPQAAHVAQEGDVLGRMEIPRIGLSVIVLQGTTPKTLRMGAGHIDGTALPGAAGNIGIAAHRDTFFRDLKDIQVKDEIEMETISGVTTYVVDWMQITAPTDGGIVAATKDSSLTLVTCYPFHYVGSAPERFVVHAHRQ